MTEAAAAAAAAEFVTSAGEQAPYRANAPCRRAAPGSPAKGSTACRPLLVLSTDPPEFVMAGRGGAAATVM